MLWGSDKKKAAPNNEWVRANSAPAGVMWLFFRAKMDFWGLAGQRKKRVLSFVPCASGLGRQGQRRASRGESWDGCGQSRTGICRTTASPQELGAQRARGSCPLDGCLPLPLPAEQPCRLPGGQTQVAGNLNLTLVLQLSSVQSVAWKHTTDCTSARSSGGGGGSIMEGLW